MTPKNKALLCIGHRGACAHAPENTLASVRKALELGAPCLEIDVYHVDRHLVVFHDDRLERTTNGTGYLLEQRFETLRTLDAGCGERIPTLEEVFETVDRRAGVNIELKGPATARPVVGLLAELRRGGWPDELILVSSFDHRQLAEVRRLDPGIRIGALIVGLPVDDAAFAAALGAYSVHLSLEFIDRRFVADAHARGLQVFVFTVNHPEDIRKMAQLGVDGVFTDFPERVLGLYPQTRPPLGWGPPQPPAGPTP
ncbi:MAG TPA: glycerophosphodiester phosphodiesterase [Desulfobacterales bacterium]|nr:glycerophosphodiester phosphodiesterase [Desulfobacterales bacterium]